MTGRTHDLTAVTALNLVFLTQPLPEMSFATAVAAVSATMIGGLLPDIDNASSDIWDKVPAGSFFGRVLHPLFGHHRMISHSIVGMAVAGFLLRYILTALSSVILVDMNVVWWALMIGYVSHLIADSVTVEGVPWFFPIPIRMGFPPFQALRIKTGGIVEKVLIFPGLLIANGYLIFLYYPAYLGFLRHILK